MPQPQHTARVMAVYLLAVPAVATERSLTSERLMPRALDVFNIRLSSFPLHTVKRKVIENSLVTATSADTSRWQVRECCKSFRQRLRRIFNCTPHC